MAPCVLVVDQTFGDVSVSKGNADADAFRRMLDTACAENPDAEVWVKVHPDVLCGKKAGYFAGLKNNAQYGCSLKTLAHNRYCATSNMFMSLRPSTASKHCWRVSR
jgi:capsule polysaccharide export protein KpsC/LpsZ